MPKGLSALIPHGSPSMKPSTAAKAGRAGSGNMMQAMDMSSPESRDKIWQISVAKIISNTQQPRIFFDPQKLQGMVASIRTYGILQPLVVTSRDDGMYEIVAGERRWRAAKELGLKTVPAILRATKEMEKLELALIENLQREDLDPIECASAYRKLLDEFGLTQEEAAKRLGKPRSAIANTLRILDLPVEVQRAVARGEISEGHAKVLAGLPETGTQLATYRRILVGDLSVRATEAIIKKIPAGVKGGRRAHTSIVSEEAALLQEALATRVEIRRNGKKGAIAIHFSNTEELRRITKKIISS